MSFDVSAGDLAVEFACELRGDPSVRVDRVATLGHAESSAVTFLANTHYRAQLAGTGAGIVILDEKEAPACSATALITDNPYLLFARVATLLHPLPIPSPGVAASATIGPDCKVPESCEIAPGVTLGANVVLGERVFVGPNAFVGADACIGDDTRLMSGALIGDAVTIGARCFVNMGAIIGADGFGFAREQDGSWVKVPQVGSVRIQDDVEIGAGTAIDRGAIGDTVIENGVRLDNLIQIGHNVRIGAHTAIAGQVGVAGSAHVGARCMIGGQAGIGGHLTVADDSIVQGRTMVTHSIREAGTYAGGGVPMETAGSWRRNAARFTQLDDMARRLRKLEKRVAKLNDDASGGDAAE
jgi:UDP-3-O-[3-hydroxymyristoyl] glucosamine N-acyltransferase